MMYGHGDVEQPLQETVDVVEVSYESLFSKLPLQDVTSKAI